MNAVNSPVIRIAELQQTGMPHDLAGHIPGELISLADDDDRLAQGGWHNTCLILLNRAFM